MDYVLSARACREAGKRLFEDKKIPPALASGGILSETGLGTEDYFFIWSSSYHGLIGSYLAAGLSEIAR